MLARCTLLHRRVFSELLLLFTLCLVALLSLILVGRVLQLRELLLTLGINLLDLLQLFIYLSPAFLLLVIPVACMLAVFLTVLRMSSDRELLALRAGGVSIYQLTPAPAVFCLFCALLTLFVSLDGLSWGMSRFRSTLLQYARTKAQLILQPGVFNQEFPGLMVYARTVDIGQGLLEDVIVEDRSRPQITATILAPRGQVTTIPGKGQVIIAFEGGRIYQQERGHLNVLSFDSYQVRLDMTRLLKGIELDDEQPREMNWSTLRAVNADPVTMASQDEKYLRKLNLEMHKRWVFPVACLVLGLFALPLACAFEGLERQYGVFLALGCFLIYYTLLSLGLSLGETGKVPPWLGLWLPDALFFLGGFWGLRMAARERPFQAMHRLRRLRALVWRGA